MADFDWDNAQPIDETTATAQPQTAPSQISSEFDWDNAKPVEDERKAPTEPKQESGGLLPQMYKAMTAPTAQDSMSKEAQDAWKQGKYGQFIDGVIKQFGDSATYGHLGDIVNAVSNIGKMESEDPKHPIDVLNNNAQQWQPDLSSFKQQYPNSAQQTAIAGKIIPPIIGGAAALSTEAGAAGLGMAGSAGARLLGILKNPWGIAGTLIGGKEVLKDAKAVANKLGIDSDSIPALMTVLKGGQ